MELKYRKDPISRSESVGPRNTWASRTMVFEAGMRRGLARIANPVKEAQPAAEGFS